jgi:hypothetical protein
MKLKLHEPCYEEKVLGIGLSKLPVRDAAVENAVGFVHGAISERMKWRKVVIASVPNSRTGFAAGLALAAVICVVFVGIRTGYINFAHTEKVSAEITSILFPGRLKYRQRIDAAVQILDSARDCVINASQKTDNISADKPLLDSISSRIDSCRKKLSGE